MSINNSAPPPRPDLDAVAMRAMAHPLRLAILEALSRREPMNATEAAEMIGATPQACSFHMRMLAKYGLIEDAGGGRGRQRPWRRSSPGGFTFPATDADPQTALAASALSDLVWGRYLDRARAVLSSRPAMTPEWLEITSAAQTVAYVTQEEAGRFRAELWELIDRYRSRLEDPATRPSDAVPLEILLFTYPLDATGASR